MRNLKKKFNIAKKADLDTILKDYEVNIDEPLDNGKCLLHLLIIEEDIDNIKLVLNLKTDYKSKKADPNMIDTKYKWSPLVTAINQGPNGYTDALYELLRAKADPCLEVEGLTTI